MNIICLIKGHERFTNTNLFYCTRCNKYFKELKQ